MAGTKKLTVKKKKRKSKEAEREELILQHLALVKQVLRYVAAHLPPHVDREDVLEAGMIGLVDAARRFDPKRKVMFSTYAVTRIRGAMLDSLRDEDWLPRSARNEIDRIEDARCELAHENNGMVTADEICLRLNMPKEKMERLGRVAAIGGFRSLDYIPSGIIDPCHNGRGTHVDYFTQPAERAIFEEQKEALAEAVRKLPEREQLVISLYYFEQQNLREIADMLGVTNSRACQIHRSALRRLQRLMRMADHVMVTAAAM